MTANFAAQLPELVRGAYYDGWGPSVVPVKYVRQAYVDRFVHEAEVTVPDVPGGRTLGRASLMWQLEDVHTCQSAFWSLADGGLGPERA
ncbi:hypothetical protein ACWDZ8_11210 [Streptomyces sp. NPDC003233]